MQSTSPFKPSAASAETLAKSILTWWKDAQYETTGDRGERNVFDFEPDFVTMAKTLLGEHAGKSYLEVCKLHVQELEEAIAEFKEIAANKTVADDFRWTLVMADGCKGRILRIFEALGIPLELEFYDPARLGYEGSISLTSDAIDDQYRNVAGLLNCR